jgi:histidinol phosphatase-like PHP family hydrolase
MPDGTRLQRRFNSEADTVEHVINYIIKTSGKVGATVRLNTAGFPKKQFERGEHGAMTLKEAGITKNEAFIAEIKV